MDSSVTLNSIYFHTANIALFCLCINVALCLLFWKKLNTPFKQLAYFLIWNVIIEILVLIVAALGYKNNLPLLHVYTLGEFILFSFFYRSLLDKPVFFRKYFWHFLTLGSLLIVYNSIAIQSIFVFNSFSKTFVQLTIIGFAIVYFYNLVENQQFSPVISKSLRLINSAILVYYSGSLFIFMCSNVYFENAQVYDIFWIFNALLNVLFHLLILVGLWKVFFKKTTL
ncbi:hypothetical protein [uncultured Kordia sp.]|uniref:hypothetical protein n=1 Tax=uncultured Kordia sp. TaxID=507699 RepID=UPI00262C2658|nr:hypothetical protein [uncultured Kordia sp.]